MNTMADGAAQRCVAQIGEALFGQPGMTIDEIANRLRELRGEGGPLLTDVGNPVSPSPAGQGDALDEVACDLPYLFGRASLEGHEAGQRLAKEVQGKMRAALAALQPLGEDGQPMVLVSQEFKSQAEHDSETASAVGNLLRNNQIGLSGSQPGMVEALLSIAASQPVGATAKDSLTVGGGQAVGQIPAGFVLVPEKFGIPADVWEGVEFVIGGPGTGESEAYLDSTAWIGDLIQDDGSAVYGLHLSCDECPEEGSVTLSEFTARPEVQQ